MKTVQRKLGIGLLAIAGLIVGIFLSRWLAGTLEYPIRMLAGAAVLFLLGMLAITGPGEDGNS